MKNSRYHIWFIVLVAIATLALAVAVIPAAAESSTLIATVNGRKLTEGDVQRQLDLFVRQMSKNVPASQIQAALPRVRDRIISELIDREILLDAVEKENIDFSQEEYDSALQELTAELPPDITLQGFMAESGLTDDDLRAQMRIRKLLLLVAFRDEGEDPESTVTSYVEGLQNAAVVERFDTPSEKKQSEPLPNLAKSGTDSTDVAMDVTKDNLPPRALEDGLVSTDVGVEVTAKWLRWNDPDAEKQWEKNIQTSKRLSLQPRMKGVDETQAEGQLEAFGTRYMPNAYAQYQEVRERALELEEAVKENFPEGKDSDPTGGAMFEKANMKLAIAVANTFRRRDELCFFLVFRQAGIFSENELAEYDSHPISIRLEEESADWPYDTPKADTALAASDATFAAKYMPETHLGYQRLGELFEEGAKQYAELRQTALDLGAPRARCELMILKARLGNIQEELHRYKQQVSAQRLAHAFEDTTAETLAALDQANAVKLQDFVRKMDVKVYAEQMALRMVGKVTLPGGETMEMVWCPPGAFMMGSDDGDSDELPRHQVTLTKGFWMGKTEVTQKQWKSVMGNNPSDFKGDNLPVEQVSWEDCQEFCRKTGLQLPTEAQWEYACRAGSTGKYAGTGNLDDMGWYADNSDYKTHPVGQKQPNAWGLYDMHGNVWEWCADWYGGYPDGAVTDPQGPSSGSSWVVRGGSWGFDASYCTSAYRYYSSYASYADSSHCYGFRLVRTLSE